MAKETIGQSWDYLYRIDYFRLGKAHSRVLAHTERVADAGWCFRRAGMTRNEWLAYYTEMCAREFLDRVGAAKGTWIVIVYEDRGPNDQRLLCSVRLSNHNPDPAQSARVDPCAGKQQ
jgi:hypothetical protein